MQGLKAKNVLFVTGSFPPEVGGIQNYVYNLCKYSRHHVTVLAPHYKGDASFDAEQNFQIVRKDFLRRKNFLLSGFNLLKEVFQLVRNNQIDLIVCNHVLVSTIGNVIGFITKKPFICITYGKDTLEFLNNFLLKQIVHMNLRKAKHIITCSNYTKQIVEGLINSTNKVSSVLPGVDPKFKPMVKNQKLLEKYDLHDKKILFTVGRLVERKGHDMVIKALPDCINKIPNLVYLIIGDGEYADQLKTLVKELDLEGHVKFVGKIDEDELVDFYNLGDVFIMPCRFVEDKGSVEGFGIVFLEAAACRKPIIGGNSGGAPEAVGVEGTGLLVDPLNTKEISESITRIFEHPSLANEMADKAYERVHQEFSYEKLSEKLDNIISEIC